MLKSNAPVPYTIPWANSGTKNTIPVASQIGITAGAASFNDGFPPLTFTPIASGGVPPFGADTNGILYDETLNTLWQQAGFVYAYNSTFSSNQGGYPAQSLLMRSDGKGLWLNLADSNTTNPDATGAANWTAVRANIGSSTISVIAGTNTPDPSVLGPRLLIITGSLSSAATLVLPLAAGASWLIYNATTGSGTLGVQGSTGTGVTVAQSTVVEVVTDGTNYYTSNFNGSGVYLPINGTAVAASKLATARTIAMKGDVSWTSPAFDGSANVASAGTIAAGAVTLAKMAIFQANSLMGNPTGSSATPSAITLASPLTFSGSTLALSYQPVNKAGDTMSGTLNISGPQGPLNLTSGNGSDTYLLITNTSTGGRAWAVGTAGTTPPTGLAAGDFFVYDNGSSVWRFRIDASGQSHFSARPDFNGNVPWDTGNLTPLDVNNGGTVHAELIISTPAGAPGVLTLTSADTSNTYMVIANTSPGSARWAIGTSGATSPPNGTAAADFFLYNYNLSKAVFRIDNAAGQAHFAVRPDFNGATPWDSNNVTPLDRNTGGTVNAPVTISSGSNPIPLSLTSASATDTYIDLTNTSTGGRSWAVGTAGQTAPTGTSTGDFFLFDLTGNAWRQRIDSSGNFYFSGNLTSYGTSVNFNSTSDARVKTNLVAAEPQCIHQEWFGEYDRTDREVHGRGVLAQGVRKHMPMYVVEDASVKVPGTNEPLLGVAHAAVALEQSIWCGRKIDKIIAALAAAGIEVD